MDIPNYDNKTFTITMTFTVKYLYDTMKDIAGKIDKRCLKKECISTLNGRLYMSQHRISDLADPVLTQ